jgi:hypothetical protein
VAQTEAEKSSNIPSIKREKVIQKKTKPTILESPTVLANLEVAFRAGATQEQAASHADCSLTALKNHLRDKTPVLYNGTETTFDELVERWKGSLVLRAKLKLSAALDDKMNGIAIAKWILERLERQTYGNEPPVLPAYQAPMMNLYEEGKRGLEAARKVKLR